MSPVTMENFRGANGDIFQQRAVFVAGVHQQVARHCRKLLSSTY